jgi:hypothetical protein
MGIRHIDPPILDLSTSWRWVVSFTHQLLYPWESALGTHWRGDWVGVWMTWKEDKSYPYQDIASHCMDCASHCMDCAIPTSLQAKVCGCYFIQTEESYLHCMSVNQSRAYKIFHDRKTTLTAIPQLSWVRVISFLLIWESAGFIGHTALALRFLRKGGGGITQKVNSPAFKRVLKFSNANYHYTSTPFVMSSGASLRSKQQGACFAPPNSITKKTNHNCSVQTIIHVLTFKRRTFEALVTRAGRSSFKCPLLLRV